MDTFDFSPLIAWFKQSKRELPWRSSPTPYEVWVSEVMLQQTQVSVVIPFFLRWMNRFPTLEALADASIDEVIKEWEGLGYYSRARSLHAGAKYVLENHGGIIPDNAEELGAIKGLGPYTIGAILSFAFHKKAPAVDGNVVRVLTRYFNIQDDISKQKTMAFLRQRALAIMPEGESWVFNEALIELGATICLKKPKCRSCPVKRTCLGYNQGTSDTLPFKSAKIKIETLFRAVPVIQCGSSFLVKRGEAGKIMSDLYEFPYFETDPEGLAQRELTKKIGQLWGLEVSPLQEMLSIQHSFTRFRVNLSPVRYACNQMKKIEGFQWIEAKDLLKLAFSSGHRKIFQLLCDSFGSVS